MATTQRTVDVILEAIGGAGAVSAKKMFGEWGVYCDGKLVALVCDDQLFVKITAAGRAWLGDAVDEAPAYPGAKPSFRVDAERWDDADWMTELVRATLGGVAGAQREDAEGQEVGHQRCALPRGVIPAKAGTHFTTCAGFELGPCFRRDDTSGGVATLVAYQMPCVRPG